MSTPLRGYARHASVAPHPHNVNNPPRSASRPRDRSVSVRPLRPDRFGERYKAELESSKQRLRSYWDHLAERYQALQDDEDDEVDLTTLKVVRNRGRLTHLLEQGYGRICDSDDSSSDFEQDEDELGAWDERSGLDSQVPPLPDPPTYRPWTQEDYDDLKSFHRANNLMVSARGEADDSDSDESDMERMDQVHSRDESTDEKEGDRSPRSRGTTIFADVSDLFPQEDEWIDGSSDDELLAQTSDAEEATRTVPVEKDELDGESLDDHLRPRSKSALDQLPSWPIPKQRAESSRLSRSPPTPSLRDLFTPPIANSLTHNRAGSSTSPSLRDLFTPPHDTSPPSASNIVAASTRPRPQSQVPLITHSSKGKNRMPGERPSEAVSSSGLDPTAYHCVVWHSRNGVTLRCCKLCKAAGGVRGQRAIYCKGRKSPMLCTFKVHRHVEEENRPVIKQRSRVRPRRSISRPPPNSSNETPFGLDRSRYHSKLQYSHQDERIRRCLSCKKAGGTRAERAPWCKGQRRPSECTFKDEDEEWNTTLGETTDDLESVNSDMPQHSRHRTPRPRQTADDESSADDVIYRKTRGKRASSSPPPSLDPLRYSTVVIWPRRGKNPRSCKYCRRAGGERARYAKYCIGKTWAKNCSFLFKNESFTPAPTTSSMPTVSPVPTASPINTGSPQTPIRATTSPSRTPHSSTSSGEPGFYPELRYARDGHTRASCKACKAAGGDRKDKAPWCKGRRLPRLCAYASSPDEDPGEESEDDSRPLRAMSDQFSRMKTPQSSMRRTSRKEIDDNDKTMPSSSHKKRKRIIRSTPSVASPIVTHVELPGPATPSSISRRVASSPIRQTTISTASPEHDDTLLNLQSSLPPSSPPLARSPLMMTRPTPSPSVCISAVGASRLRFAASFILPTSPLPRPIASRRGAAITFRPTPPPSSTEARSSSISSDHIPLCLPPKGILRQPSVTSFSSGHRPLKRIRFSLAPRSPPREISSDPLLPSPSPDSDEDELILRSTISPMPSQASSSSPFNHSSSPLSREMSVRAADVGFDLGTEHTGRLPSGLLAALTPALAQSSRPTLGSSIMVQDHVVNTRTYARPTPPRSFGSTTSTMSTSRPTPVPTSPGTAALMLPPPVPSKRAASARPPTPVSGAEDGPNETIYQTVTPPPRSRSRSRSMSAAPVARMRSVPPHPASTPRKKSRLECDLARVAREIGDDCGLEWGLDEDAGEEHGRMWREGSVVKYVQQQQSATSAVTPRVPRGQKRV